MILRLLYAIILIWTCITFSNCNGGKTEQDNSKKDTIPTATEKDKSIPGNFSTQTKLTFDSNIVKIFLDSFPKFEKFRKDMVSFYQRRNFAYAWFDENGMIEPANNLFNRMQHISDEGIPDKLPYKEPFTQLMEAEVGGSKPSPFTELMLTSQYLVYAKNVWEGLSKEQSLSLQWLLPRKKTSASALLDSLSSGKNIFENAPVYRQYNLLKTQLEKYYTIQTTNNWEPIKTFAKKYIPGDSSEVIQKIRERMFILGDIKTNTQNNRFDEELESGIKSFQRRYGYTPDGIITPTLMAEINYPIEKRIEQIIVNMERCRWVPVKLNNNYLVVNIPEYKLHVYENDSLTWSMNVVVGKDQHKTVVFNGNMKYIVFSPYWNIPASIMRKETLPALRRNRNYLAKHNMEWYNGSIRQKPGPNNSLGLVKFLFPNSHSIYLHDTPAKSLFNEDNRAFSHGCIRLAEAKKLAMYLLKNDTAWSEEKITAAMTNGVEQYVTLKNTIPVFIAYFTAWVDRQGKINFRKDVYQRDQRLAQMILEKPAI